MSAILPFLSRALPPTLAAMGISKIDPRIKKFLAAAGAAGFTTDAAMDYMRNIFQVPGADIEKQRLSEGAMSGTLRPDEAASLQGAVSGALPERALKGAAGIGKTLGAVAGGLEIAERAQGGSVQRSDPFQILSKYSKDLAERMKSGMQKGSDPVEVARVAKNIFPTETLRVERDYKRPFEEVVQELFQVSTSESPSSQTQALQGQGTLRLIDLLDELKDMRGG